MWNLFEKSNKTAKNPDQMGFLERLAMKKFMSMSEEEKMNLMQKMMTPENIAKNKDKILAVMEQMKSSGQITEEQIKMAKKKLGL
jgi:hypothetical protein